jgi:hypothetical protein
LPENFVFGLCYVIVCLSDNLTLTLLESKVINLCHQYKARSACSVVKLGCILLANQLQIFILISQKLKTDGLKMEDGLVNPFKKFSSLRENICFVLNSSVVCVCLWYSKVLKHYLFLIDLILTVWLHINKINYCNFM